MINKPPVYRIIYNWDGAPYGYSEVPQSMDAFLNKVYAPLTDTQVDALFWCIGEHATRWPSDVLELLGDVHGRHYENASVYIHTENIRQMLERGEDPQQELIERGGQLGLHIYASVRMNDNHFNGRQIADLNNLHHTELTRLRIEHPEWLLGDKTSEWFALSWDFTVPEVREHRYTHIKELCKRYDWDGVELDWQRHDFHLPDDEGYRLRYILTDLQRAVRQMTNDLAKKRGRPFYLAARVSSTLETCRNIGYDLPTWVNERLIDLLIPAGGVATDPSLDVTALVELCRNKEIAIYPGFDGGLPGQFVGPEDTHTKNQMRTRAIASRYYEAGADGMYVFNWHANRDSRRALLSQVGSTETLVGTDKIYAATHRFLQKEGQWRGAYRNDRIRGEVPVTLKRALTNTGPTVILNVADDLKTEDTVNPLLRLRLDQWVGGDVVHVQWDGTTLPAPQVLYDTDDISDVGAAVWLYYTLTMGLVTIGVHTVEVVLEKQNPKVASDIVLTDVELVIQCPKAGGQTHELIRTESEKRAQLNTVLRSSVVGR